MSWVAIRALVAFIFLLGIIGLVIYAIIQAGGGAALLGVALAVVVVVGVYFSIYAIADWVWSRW